MKPLGIRHKLAGKLALWVGCLLIVLTAAAAFIASRALEHSSMERMRETGGWFSDTVKRATRHAMLTDQRQNMLAILDAIGAQPGVDLVRVFNKEGRVVYSNLPNETGSRVDKTAGACAGCHQSGAAQERLAESQTTRVFHLDQARAGRGGRVLGVVNPIYTEPACYTDPCHVHPAGKKVLGVLEVGLSLASVDKEVESAYHRVVGYALFACLVAAVLLGLMTRFLLIQPLSHLNRAAGRIAKGDYDQPVTPSSQDEIGSLALALEQMRQSVKQKTRALKESRQQFQTLFEQVPCYISVQDKDFKLVALNTMFARDFSAQIGEYCYRCYKGLDHKCNNCAVEKSFADGKVHSSEETVTHADGTTRYMLNLTAPILDAKGDIVAVMEMGTDVTKIRHLEDELIKSEEKYRLFFDNDPNSIFVFDQASHEILDANDRALSEFGYAKEELIGMSFEQLLESAEQERLNSLLSAGGRLLARLQMRIKSGQSIMVNLRASFGEHLGRKAVIAATADISEILEAEEQLVQAAKMATLGEMSAGIAHELNQPLSVLATSARILTKQQSGTRFSPEIIAEVAREVAQQVERATRIINHLREFGRKNQVERSRVDLLSPLNGVFQLMGQQLKVHDIKVEIETPQHLPAVWGEQNRLEQVFINLVLNARDSIDEKRRAKPGMKGVISIQAGSRKDMVWVRISDNGVGIPPNILDRVFEPFFTTKEVGKGTGLGLSISYGIIRDFGGSIEAESQPGMGASFTLNLLRAGEDD